jgi:chromosome segregation ATPase
MDTETRVAIAALTETMNAGFARMDRYFELQQAQFVEWRAELRGEIAGLRERVDTLTERVDTLSERVDTLSERVDTLTERVARLEPEVARLRDFVAREFAEIRLELRELRAQPGQTDELRREIAGLATRVERIERRID